MSSSQKISRNSVSLAGEFAVLSQLALKGIDANLTLGNTKGVDILASDPETKEFYRIEVKTNLDVKEEHNSKLFGRHVCKWVMQEKHERCDDRHLWYCFVKLNNEGDKHRYFIVPNNVVGAYVKEQHRFWLEDDPGHKDSAMRSFRIGFKKDRYRIKTPTDEKYEDNWAFKR